MNPDYFHPPFDALMSLTPFVLSSNVEIGVAWNIELVSHSTYMQTSTVCYIFTKAWLQTEKNQIAMSPPALFLLVL